MRITINLGLEQRPVKLDRNPRIGSDYRVVYDYFDDLTGSKVALRAACDASAWLPPHDFCQHPDFSQPKILAGEIVSPAKVEFSGYKGSDFELVTL